MREVGWFSREVLWNLFGVIFEWNFCVGGGKLGIKEVIR